MLVTFVITIFCLPFVAAWLACSRDALDEWVNRGDGLAFAFALVMFVPFVGSALAIALHIFGLLP